MIKRNNIYYDGICIPAPNIGTCILIEKGCDDSTHITELQIPNDDPIFVNITYTPLQLYIHCNNCMFIGVSAIQKKRGLTYYLLGVLSLGYGMCMNKGHDTIYYCPSCFKKLGYSRYFL
jgi:hypothetical protein